MNVVVLHAGRSLCGVRAWSSPPRPASGRVPAAVGGRGAAVRRHADQRGATGAAAGATRTAYVCMATANGRGGQLEGGMNLTAAADCTCTATAPKFLN